MLLTHYNLTALLQQIAPLLSERPGDRVLSVLPFFHIFGLQVLMNYTLRYGITCVTMPRFDLELFLRYIQDYRMTHLYLVPPLVLALAKQPLVDAYDLCSLATRLTIDPEGWLHTGDIASIDDKGYLFVVDRLKELIKYKGMQVAPAEREGELLTHQAVTDPAVIGIPDAEAGVVPKAFVVLKNPVTSDVLMHDMAGQVAPHKRIRQVEVVEAIPKSASGKILRRVLVGRERATHVIPP